MRREDLPAPREAPTAEVAGTVGVRRSASRKGAQSVRPSITRSRSPRKDVVESLLWVIGWHSAKSLTVDGEVARLRLRTKLTIQARYGGDLITLDGITVSRYYCS